MKRKLMLGMACAGLSWTGLACPALAEQQTTSQGLGDPYYLYAAKTYGDHAADHVHILRQFLSTGSSPSVDWLRQHLAAVRSNADAARQAYAGLSADVKTDPLDAEQLTEIGEQYARVLDICDHLDEACAAAPIDVAAVSRVLDQLQSSLSGARAAYQDLAIVSASTR